GDGQDAVDIIGDAAAVIRRKVSGQIEGRVVGQGGVDDGHGAIVVEASVAVCRVAVEGVSRDRHLAADEVEAAAVEGGVPLERAAGGDDRAPGDEETTPGA